VYGFPLESVSNIVPITHRLWDIRLQKCCDLENRDRGNSDGCCPLQSEAGTGTAQSTTICCGKYSLSFFSSLNRWLGLNAAAERPSRHQNVHSVKMQINSRRLEKQSCSGWHHAMGKPLYEV